MEWHDPTVLVLSRMTRLIGDVEQIFAGASGLLSSGDERR